MAQGGDSRRTAASKVILTVSCIVPCLLPFFFRGSGLYLLYSLFTSVRPQCLAFSTGETSTRSPIFRFSSSHIGFCSFESHLFDAFPGCSGTSQQFYEWFTLADRFAAQSQESPGDYHHSVETRDGVLDWIELLEGEVIGMLEGWRGVEEGEKVKDACERLLLGKVSYSLVSLCNSGLISWLVVESSCEGDRGVEQCLQCFRELGPATRTLNHPGGSLILQADFSYRVERVCMGVPRHFRVLKAGFYGRRQGSASSTSFIVIRLAHQFPQDPRKSRTGQRNESTNSRPLCVPLWARRHPSRL